MISKFAGEEYCYFTKNKKNPDKWPSGTNSPLSIGLRGLFNCLFLSLSRGSQKAGCSTYYLRAFSRRWL